MATRQYIGARYVPKFFEGADGTSNWQPNVIYEPLTIVTYNQNTYTSKKTVPATIGSPNTNPEYWANTGLENQQISELSSRIEAVDEKVDNVETKIERMNAYTQATLTYNGETLGNVRKLSNGILIFHVEISSTSIMPAASTTLFNVIPEDFRPDMTAFASGLTETNLPRMGAFYDNGAIRAYAAQDGGFYSTCVGYKSPN